MCSRSAECDRRSPPHLTLTIRNPTRTTTSTHSRHYSRFHDYHDYHDCHRSQVIAAHRAGVTRVLLPAANEKDLHDLPEQAKAELSIVLVRTLEEALPLALEPLSHKEPLEEAKELEAHEVAADEQQRQQQQTGRTQGLLASRL